MVWDYIIISTIIGLIVFIIVYILLYVYQTYNLRNKDKNDYIDPEKYEEDFIALAIKNIDSKPTEQQEKEYDKIIDDLLYKKDIKIKDINNEVVSFNKEDIVKLEHFKNEYRIVLKHGEVYIISRETTQELTKKLLKGVK